MSPDEEMDAALILVITALDARPIGMSPEGDDDERTTEHSTG